MIKSNYIPHKIYITQESLRFPLTHKIISKLKQIPHEIINNHQSLIEDFKCSEDPVSQGKKFILLAQQKGEFVKPCPCTPYYLGCNYFIINLELNCPLDCSYCILQSYLSNPLITIHVNLEDLWRELDVFIAKRKGSYFRIGTGELGDSLALDNITELSQDLISYFRQKPHVWFELKTKTVNISHLRKLKPPENVVVSWSLNSSIMAQEQEKGAPSIAERILAAKDVSERGFWVGFHFDPLIHYQGWEKGYAEVVKMLFRQINPAKIAWISLGSLRFPPDLKAIITKRFPKAKIFFDEFIKGLDGKYRYLKSLRLKLYSHIVKSIVKHGGSKIPLYFCMESKDIWRSVLGWEPKGKKEIEQFLSCPLADKKLVK